MVTWNAPLTFQTTHADEMIKERIAAVHESAPGHKADVTCGPSDIGSCADNILGHAKVRK